MPRGRPKRKPAEVEILPPEENSQSIQQIREVKHKTEWVELRPVEDTTEDGDLDLTDDIEAENKPRRKTPKHERDELRKKLAQVGATVGSQLKLTVERYLHSDVVDGSGGVFAETEHCTKYVCAESHVTGEDYIDVARRYGPGLYRFTLRMQNKIVTAWDKRISATPAGPVIQSVNPNDPTSPQFIIQTTADGQQQAYQPPSMRDIMKAQKEAFKEQLEMAKLMREAYGISPEQPQQQPKSEEEILTTAILKQPEVVENLVGGVLKRFGKGGDSDEPWYADVVRDAVKSGQAAQIVQVAIDRIFNGFQGLFPGGQSNGQTQVGAQTVPPMANTQDANPQESRPALPTLSEGQGIGAIQETVGSVQGQETQGTVTPEQHALARLIDNCQRNVPVQVAFQQLINYADAVNEQAPDYSIDGYIDLLGSVTTDQAFDYVKTLPNGEQIVSLPHAKEWTTELQRLIKESQEVEE